MASTASQSLRALLQKASLDDHEEILKASNVALKSSKKDLDAQYVKAVALLKLDRYDEAVRWFETSGDALKEEAQLAYAYALYKVGRLQEAADIAAKITDQRGARHVEAQAKYRAEDFSETTKLYDVLAAENITSEHYDLYVNRGAVDAQAAWAGLEQAMAGKKPTRQDLDAFETAYNAACGSIARGELRQAEVLLKRAKELCKHSEDLTPQQKADELLPISVQQMFVLQRLGKTGEAESLASEIQVESISDLSTKAIALNNSLTCAPPANAFLAHKNFTSTPNIPESDRLFSFQSTALIINSKILDLQSFKYDGVASSTATAVSKNEGSPLNPISTSLSVLNAAAHARNEIGKGALRKVLPELEKRPNDIGLVVTVLQMYVLTNNITSAIDLLESFFKRSETSKTQAEQDLRFNPGLVSVLIGLYRMQGCKSAVKRELAKAASFWKQKQQPPMALLKAAGISLLESTNVDDSAVASEIFDKLRQRDPKDPAVVAGYVASHANPNDSSTKAEVDKLKSVASLIRGVDVDVLEQTGIPQSSNALAIAQMGLSRKRAAVDDASAKPKRVRKSRLPKEYDASKAPDPERWLPLRDRSTYRPKGKRRGKKDGGDRTQGGVVAEDVGVNGAQAKQQAAAGGGGAKKKRGKGCGQQPWVVVAHPSGKGDNWNDLLKEVVTFDTVEEFWGVHNNITACSDLGLKSDYHLFKKGVRPEWEDSQNKHGGKWSYSFKDKRSIDIDEIWLHTQLSAIGETLEDEIMGVVVNVRKGFYRVGI